MKRIFSGVVSYLKDWKNLLMHSLIGLGLLCAALFLPVHPAIRIGLLLGVVVFNLVRMALSRRSLARATKGKEREPTP